MSIVTYDIETLKSCFTYTDIDFKTNEIHQFVLHKDRFELKKLVKYLLTVKGQIGFNNLNFDYPVIHYIISEYTKNVFVDISNEEWINKIYNKAQEIINLQDDKDAFYKTVAIKDSDKYIPQLDLFKIWHYNNKARSTSLKSLEISMNYPNVMDMPISHTRDDITIEEIDSILEYNLNDVLATNEFLKKTKEFGKIDLRKKLAKKFDLPCMNWNNGKIGEQLILKLYCDKTGKNYWDVKKLRTYRKSIDLGICIPDNVEFVDSKFKAFKTKLENTIVSNTKGAFKESIVHKKCKYDYGTGGIHGTTEKGIYKSDDKYIIKTADVASLYPNLAIVLNLYMQHLGPEFLEIYKNDIVKVRMDEKKKPKYERDNTIVDGYKEAANIPYGKSNDINSFLYDPLYTLKTTIAGQLYLTMLAERLANIPDSQVLMINTDGLEIRIPRTYEDEYFTICKDWEEKTKLVLEYDDYSTMWIWDVNNYMAQTTTGKLKNKGRFEVDKKIGSEPAYHKDNSFRIIPLAIQEYFTTGKTPEETIKNHLNNTVYSNNENYGIYDFCGRQKFTKDSYGAIHVLKYDDTNNPYTETQKQQKNVRYYIANKGQKFIKYYTKGTTEAIHVGYTVTIFNKYVKKDNYDINYDFYIKEAWKEIKIIESQQLNLFE